MTTIGIIRHINTRESVVSNLPRLDSRVRESSLRINNAKYPPAAAYDYEKKLTPDQDEGRLHAERIYYILDKVMEKIDVIAYLPFLTENEGAVMAPYLTSQEHSFIKKAFHRYRDDISEFERSSDVAGIVDLVTRINARKSSSLQSRDMLFEDRFDPYIAQAIDIIYRNEKLKEDMMSAENAFLDVSVMRFKRYINHIKTYIRSKLELSVDQEVQKDTELRRAYVTNRQLLEHIKNLSEQIDKQREELNIILEHKAEVINNLNAKIQKLIEHFDSEWRQIVQDSEKEMFTESVKSETLQEELAADAKMNTQQYHSILEEHLQTEKDLRKRRYRIETQLASWLTKYDQDVGEKQAEFEEIKRLHEEALEKKDNLQDLLDEQEDEYDIVVKERQEEEDRYYYEISYRFLINRMAKRIQRYWRAYRERKLARKKARRAKAKGKEKSAGKKSAKSDDKKTPK